MSPTLISLIKEDGREKGRHINMSNKGGKRQRLMSGGMLMDQYLWKGQRQNGEWSDVM